MGNLTLTHNGILFNVRKVTKPRAIKCFEDGITVFLQPNKLPLNSPVIQPTAYNRKILGIERNADKQFEAIVDNYTTYNCMYTGRGDKPSFYVPAFHNLQVIDGIHISNIIKEDTLELFKELDKLHKKSNLKVIDVVQDMTSCSLFVRVETKERLKLWAS